MPQILSNKKVQFSSMNQRVGTGWLPPMIDPRDYEPDHPKIKKIVDKLEDRLKDRKLNLFSKPPKTVDLRPWCSPVEDQQSLGSCTAHAAVGVVEYFQIRSFGKHLDASRLFVYKATRNLMGVTGDTGAWLRNTMGALVTCGVPEERYWQYTDAPDQFDVDPPAFVYAVADNFEALKYFCHDPIYANPKPSDVLASVKQYLAVGIPSMFGFWGYGSFDYGDKPGHIPMPSDAELQQQPNWGHAIVAVGYDDNYKIKNTWSGKTTTGAFLIRNSWGSSWGDHGYGWIPYDYVKKRIAMDFWSLISMEWVDTDQFI